MRRFVLTALLLIICSCAIAQDKTRAGAWEEERKKKSATLKPFKNNIVESVMLRVEKGAGFNIKGFYPTYGGLSTGSGYALGVRYWRHRPFNTRLDLQASASYSIKSYQLYQFQFGSILQRGPEPFVGFGGTGGLSEFRGKEKRKRNTFLYTDMRYYNFAQEDFYGLGDDSQKENRTNYLLEAASFDGVFGYKWTDQIVTAVRAGYTRSNIRSGGDDRFPSTEEVFDEASAPGLTANPDFVQTTVVSFFDYRDNPGHPHSGGMYGFQYSRFEDVDEGQFDFNRYVVDLRQYVPLGSPQRVLAGRALAILHQADAGNEVPFYAMSTLGGNYCLRGYNELRFRDSNLVCFSAEYRWEGAPALEFALFADAGQVFPDTSDFSLDDLRTSYGFGVRFKTPSATFMRFDTAHGREGTRFVVNFGASF